MNRIKLLSWNVNGIRGIHKKGFLEWLLKEDPDIVGLQETKAQLQQLPDELIHVPGYDSFFSSSEKKGYSGVVVYSKIEPKKVSAELNIRRFDKEGRTMMLDYGEFILFNIYFPNGKMSQERLQYKMDFYETFLAVIDRLKIQGRRLVICGDVNTAHKEIDLARPRENQKISGFLPGERAWIDKLIEHGFVDAFRLFHSEGGHYTWWDFKSRARERNVGWRIDYFFVSKSLKKNVRKAFILKDVMGSDHCPIGIELKI